ncbi:MAG: hypothetical protein ACKVP5_12260 [Aestuariivirga sp.]
MKVVALVSCLLLACGVSQAFGAQTGDWPCVQRKVPEISIAAVWRGPSTEGIATWRDEQSVVNLVQLIAARRTTEDEAAKAIADFARSAGANKQLLLLKVAVGLVETLNAERASVITGLERFGGAQKNLAELVRKENATLSDLRNDASADPALVAQQTEVLNWSLRIFEERQRSLRFVCEVPVLIEQRLFGLSREIQKALQ